MYVRISYYIHASYAQSAYLTMWSRLCKGTNLSSKQSGPNPKINCLARTHCCKCRTEPHTCRRLLPCRRTIVRVRAPSFASEQKAIMTGMKEIPRHPKQGDTLIHGQYSFGRSMQAVYCVGGSFIGEKTLDTFEISRVVSPIQPYLFVSEFEVSMVFSPIKPPPT